MLRINSLLFLSNPVVAFYDPPQNENPTKRTNQKLLIIDVIVLVCAVFGSARLVLGLNSASVRKYLIMITSPGIISFQKFGF